MIYYYSLLLPLSIITHGSGLDPGPAPPHVQGAGGRPPRAPQRGPSTWAGPGPGLAPE